MKTYERMKEDIWMMKHSRELSRNIKSIRENKGNA